MRPAILATSQVDAAKRTMNPERSAIAENGEPKSCQTDCLDPGQHRRVIVVAQVRMNGVKEVVGLVVAQPKMACRDRVGARAETAIRRSRARFGVMERPCSDDLVCSASEASVLLHYRRRPMQARSISWRVFSVSRTVVCATMHGRPEGFRLALASGPSREEPRRLQGERLLADLPPAPHLHSA